MAGRGWHSLRFLLRRRAERGIVDHGVELLGGHDMPPQEGLHPVFGGHRLCATSCPSIWARPSTVSWTGCLVSTRSVFTTSRVTVWVPDSEAETTKIRWAVFEGDLDGAVKAVFADHLDRQRPAGLAADARRWRGPRRAKSGRGDSAAGDRHTPRRHGGPCRPGTRSRSRRRQFGHDVRIGVVVFVPESTSS